MDANFVGTTLLMATSFSVGLFRRKKQNPGSQTLTAEKPAPARQPVPLSQREPDGLYQFDRFGLKQRPVGRVLDPEVDEQERVVRFGEIQNTDELLLADECEFRKYRLLIKKVEFGSKIDKQAPQKGRVLKGVTAQLLGTTEQ